MKNIYLIGFMGAGKTTVGRLLADGLCLNYVDLDEEIEKQAGLKIPQIFEQRGEPVFREIESACLRAVATSSGQVVSTGGGIVEKTQNIELLSSSGKTVFLEVELETLLERISSCNNRPLAAQENNWKSTRLLYEKRLPIYRQADFTIDANGKTADEISSEIRSLLK